MTVIDAIFRVLVDTERAHREASILFDTIRHDLAAILPNSARVEHIGATAVPGCLTKGDLDIVVRVDRADFARSETALASRYARNTGSVRTDDFAAFEDSSQVPHLGIQLTARGGNLDVFHLFARALREDPALVRHYNALKLHHDGKPEADYRIAKDAFVGEVLRSMQP